MRKWIKRLIFTTPTLFCSILCEDLNGYITSFHIKNLTEENISIKSSSLSDIVILEPGFSAEIEKTKGPSFAKLIVAIDDIKISIKKEDGTLTRN